MKRFGLAIVLILAAHATQGQILYIGRCPEVKVQQDFKLNDYMGVWFEAEKYSYTYEYGSKCIYATYKVIGADTISVVNSAISIFDGSPRQMTGTGRVVASGLLIVSFPNTWSANATTPNYEILGTDYTSYSVVYKCKPVVGGHERVIWVLTREQNPPEEVIKKAEAVIEENNLDKEYLYLKNRQIGCVEIGKEGNSGETTTVSPLA